jgi:ABC-type sugar transport system ATPase subunit
MSMIEFRSVCKEYGRRVIDTLSLKIEAKERVVLFGPSGCGKSTVLHLIVLRCGRIDDAASATR